jgi:thioesterase domain-containing protein/acyl carrier protein
MANGQVQVDRPELGIAAGQELLRRVDFGLSTPWKEPQSETELKLAEIWRHVFGLDAVGALDDFFDLGGDSFAATALAAEIEATFDVRFAPAEIVNFSTITTQAQAIGPHPSSRTQQLPPYVIVGRAEGSKPPLFIVHGGAGFSFLGSAFFDEVGQDRPIYLFEAPGVDGRTKPLKTVEEIASVYIKSMRELQPAGPYYISAMCAGSFIALEMCNQLVEAGESIPRLILLDPRPTPDALAARYPKKYKSGRLNFHTGIFAALLRISRAWRGTYDPHEQRLKGRANVLQRLKGDIRRRRAGKDDLAFPEERSYSPEKILGVTIQLHRALKTHVPRRFAGKAAIVVSSVRAHDTAGPTSFWRDHLGGLDYRVFDGNHDDIFATHLLETARFVRSALEFPS